MPPITISLQVVPGGLADQADAYAAVDAAIAVVQRSGLRYVVGPMETTIEGPYDDIMAVIKDAQDAVLAAGASRLITYIKIDYNPHGSTIDDKVAKYR